MATNLQVQAAKIGGDFITLPARIDGGGGLWKLKFSATQTEEGFWQFDLDDNYVSTPILILTYGMFSATSGKIALQVKVMAIADGEDIDTASFDTLNEIVGGTTVPGTAKDRGTITIPLTNNDSMAGGETIVIHVQRDHDSPNNTATGDFELIGSRFIFTS